MNGIESSEKFPWGRLALGLALTVLLRLPSLDLPLDRDEGEYATLALGWLHAWGLPYRDFLEQKPPLAIWAYALAFWLGGENVSAIRLFALLWTLATATALFGLALRLNKNANAALCAVALFACLSASGFTQGLSANAELFASLPLIIAISVLSYGQSSSHWVLAGILMGMAGLAKQTVLPAVVLVPLIAPGLWRDRLKHTGLCAAAVALPWFLCLGGFALADGAAEFWRCVITYNFDYAGQGLKAQAFNLGAAVFTLSKEDGVLWLALGLALWAAFKGRMPHSGPAWAWGLAMALGCVISGRYYPHYFQTLAAPMSLLAALWAFSTLPRWRSLGLLAMFVLIFAFKNAPLWALEGGEARSVRIFGLTNFARAPQIAEAIRSRSPEGSAIVIWGSEAEIFFLSRRRPATRFLFHYPFTGEAPAWPGGEEEMLQAMEDPLTSAVLVMAPLNHTDPFQRKFSALLQKHYELRVDLAPDTLIGLRKK